jgi:hypothetical protein
MERRHAGRHAGRMDRGVLSDTKHDGFCDEKARRGMLFRRLQRTTACHRMSRASRVEDRHAHRWQNHRHDVLHGIQGRIGRRLRCTTDLRRSIAAGIDIVSAAACLLRVVRENSIRMRQRHHQNEQENRRNASETPHSWIISLHSPRAASPVSDAVYGSPSAADRPMPTHTPSRHRIAVPER